MQAHTYKPCIHTCSVCKSAEHSKQVISPETTSRQYHITGMTSKTSPYVLISCIHTPVDRIRKRDSECMQCNALQCIAFRTMLVTMTPVLGVPSQSASVRPLSDCRLGWVWVGLGFRFSAELKPIRCSVCSALLCLVWWCRVR